MTRYLTIDQTAEALGVSRNTILRMLPNLGAVDLAKPGAKKRMIRIPEKGVEEYIAGKRIAPVTTVTARPTTIFYLERRRA